METMDLAVPPDTQAIASQSRELLASVEALEITDNDGFELASNYRRVAKGWLDTIGEKLGSKVTKVFDAWRGLKDTQNDLGCSRPSCGWRA